jgi:hypothetical protein
MSREWYRRSSVSAAAPPAPGTARALDGARRPSGCRPCQVLLHHGPQAVLLPDPSHDLLADALAHELPPGG